MEQLMEHTLTVWHAIFPGAIFTGEAFVTLGWLLFGKIFLLLGIDGAMQKPEMKRNRIFNIAIPEDQRAREIANSWHIISDVVIVYALLYTGLLRPAAPSWLGSLATFAVFYVWVEVYYYFIHRAMHEIKFLIPIHRAHHVSIVTTPYSASAMSGTEKWIVSSLAWIGGVAALSWVMDITLSGITAYFMFNYFITLGGHSNTESSPVSLKLAKIGMGSATTHALHHARFKVNYGFSCTLLDRLFGTYSSETDELRARALAGNGNQNMKRPREQKEAASVTSNLVN
ncbi:MAG: sterol desaturase family protein [Pseudomonadota bacterium]